MSRTSFILKRGDKVRISPEDRARLQSLSDAEIEAAAQSDPDNLPLDDALLRRMQMAREIRNIRARTGLSQPQFASRFRIGLGRLRDFEQARSEPDLLVRAFFQLVLEDPQRAETLVREVESRAERDVA